MWGAHDFVPANSVRLSPGAHHEGIIEGNNSDDVHSLLTEVWQVLNISGDVVDGTGRSKGTFSTTG
jgi:hypothetical protein